MKDVIHIYDTNEEILEVISILLSKSDYVVKTFTHIRDSDITDKPDLFIIDVSRPVLQGLDFCRHIKINEETKNIPVMLMSTMKDLSTASKLVNADACLKKPFVNGEMLKKIKILLQIKELKGILSCPDS